MSVPHLMVLSSVGDIDPYWNNVVLLLDGSGGGTATITDNSSAGNDMTNVSTGVSNLSTTGPYNSTQNVLDFDGTNDYLVETNASGDFTFGTDDFTIELWLKAGSSSPNETPGILDFDFAYGGNTTSPHGVNDYWVFHQIAGSLEYAFFANNTSGSVTKLVNTTVSNTTDWNHLAITRSGSTVKMFLNGTLASTSTSLVADMSSTRTDPKLFIGFQNLSSRYWNGEIADLRITRGVARYSGSFTPPTKSFPTR